MLEELRRRLRNDTFRDEGELLSDLMATYRPTPELEARIQASALALVDALREKERPSLMERFLAKYGLSSEEGVALMCLAEALLRVPDAPSIDALIEDKIATSDWDRHRGRIVTFWPIWCTGSWRTAPTARS